MKVPAHGAGSIVLSRGWVHRATGGPSGQGRSEPERCGNELPLSYELNTNVVSDVINGKIHNL